MLKDAIESYVEDVVDPLVDDCTGSQEVLAQGVKALWEIALHLSTLTEDGMNTYEQNR